MQHVAVPGDNQQKQLSIKSEERAIKEVSIVRRADSKRTERQKQCKRRTNERTNVCVYTLYRRRSLKYQQQKEDVTMK